MDACLRSLFGGFDDELSFGLRPDELELLITVTKGKGRNG